MDLCVCQLRLSCLIGLAIWINNFKQEQKEASKTQRDLLAKPVESPGPLRMTRTPMPEKILEEDWQH